MFASPALIFRCDLADTAAGAAGLPPSGAGRPA